MTVRILIADDHEMVRQGVRRTLETNPAWEVVGEAADGREAVELAARLAPDIVIIDLSMPAMNGLEAIRRIVRAAPGVRVLVLSMHDSEAVIQEVLTAGATAYLLKSDAAVDLVAAVQALVEGRPFFTAKVSQALLDKFIRSTTPKRESERARLTTREREIVRLIADSKTNKEIARMLNISIRTVETHRSNVMEKLGAHSVSDLVVYAIRNGLKDTLPSPPSVPPIS